MPSASNAKYTRGCEFHKVMPGSGQLTGKSASLTMYARRAFAGSVAPARMADSPDPTSLSRFASIAVYWISIRFFGCVAAWLRGSSIRSTPCLYVAFALSGSTSAGSGIARSKRP